MLDLSANWQCRKKRFTFLSRRAIREGGIRARSEVLMKLKLSLLLMLFCVPSFAQLSGNVISYQAGVFTNAQMNEYVQSIVNGCSPNTEFLAYQTGSNPTTDALTACIAIPSGATISQGNAIAGYGSTSVASHPGVAVYGQMRALVNSASAFGGNFSALDTSGLTTGVKLNGLEVDVVPANAISAYSSWEGLNSVLIARTGISGAFGQAYDVNINNNLGGTATWNFGFRTRDGAAANGILVGALCATGSCSSQASEASALNGGSDVTASWHTDSSGNFVIVPAGTGGLTSGLVNGVRV